MDSPVTVSVFLNLPVDFEGCAGRSPGAFLSQDSRFMLHPNGVVVVKRPLRLHEQELSFLVHTWDMEGRKHSARVTLQLQHHGHHRLPSHGVCTPFLCFHGGEFAGLGNKSRSFLPFFLACMQNQRPLSFFTGDPSGCSGGGAAFSKVFIWPEAAKERLGHPSDPLL